MVLEWELQHPDLLEYYGMNEHSKGILLFGLPGTGKTHTARCAAGEFKVTFVNVDPSKVWSPCFKN